MNARASGRCVLWVIQPPPGAFDAKVNDCNPSVVPGAQLMVTDAHEGEVVDRLTVDGGGAVVDDGGTVVVVVVVVVVGGVSSSVVVASRVRLATLS